MANNDCRPSSRLMDDMMLAVNVGLCVTGFTNTTEMVNRNKSLLLKNLHNGSQMRNT